MARSRWRANACGFLAFLYANRRPLRPKTASARGQFAIKFGLGHDPVAAGLLRVIERAIASIDQFRHRLAQLKLCDTDGNRDVGKRVASRAAGDTAIRD